MGPAFLLRAALLLLIAGAAVVTPADADLWGHLLFGRDILATGDPVQIDAYSFTSDKPWVNHEWLAEVVFYAIYAAGGSSGLILFKLAVIAAVLALVWRHVRQIAGPGLSWLIVAATFGGTYWRTHNIRPQLFSVLLFAFLLWCMTAADAGRRRRIWFVPLILALWTNLHGGWIVGFGVYALWAFARLMERRGSNWERLVPSVVVIVSVVATLANPWGSELWTFLGETVRPSRAEIEEWSSIAQYPLVLGIPWALTLLAVVFAIWRSGWPQRLDYLATVVGLAVLAFRVGRLDAFFVLAVVFLLAPQLARIWSEQKSSSDQPQPTGIVVITLVAILAVALPVARFAAPYATCLTISGTWAPDQPAGRFISERGLNGRMLTWFDWGEYAIWHFGPHLQVSMDGRRETVYTDATLRAHWDLYAGEDSTMTYLRQLNPDFIWLPSHLPVTKRLGEAGWSPIFTSRASAIWSRSALQPAVRPDGNAAADAPEQNPPPTSRCFPGP